ncbi:protein spaetzle 3 isoform X2 [Cimex lectularius]|uniref:Spaetzle domain-containing protein n=1 Tax=Cimex lectularius TaxID=79782 RepID=A0A8I6RW03_CIMLE|nr:protein spaetzle 3 isoform X2 [Cimex lectularius]
MDMFPKKLVFLLVWTALALGLVIRGDVIRGSPCIKKHHQLFCPTAGNTYPIERIESFIDDNKALVKRMYGDFQVSTEYGLPGQEVYESERFRSKRQSFPNKTNTSDTGRVDACQSKIEIVTPYWAANSAGKIRAVVNTQHFEQAVHQEVCSKVQTNRCSGDCGCEQKYKWHRLLAYDPDNDCKGIFMDWFLFPSCCVCRCDPDAKTAGVFGNSDVSREPSRMPQQPRMQQSPQRHRSGK